MLFFCEISYKSSISITFLSDFNELSIKLFIDIDEFILVFIAIRRNYKNIDNIVT